MGSGFAKKKKQMKALQSQMMAMQEQMEAAEHEGQAGNGLVKVTLNGSRELKAIRIKPDCVDPDDVEGLEDLIMAAFNDAAKKVEEGSAMPQMPGMPDLGSLGL